MKSGNINVYMETENERHRAIISSEIASLVQRDQDARKTGDASVTNLVDQRNREQLRAIIDQYGWPSKSNVGEKASHDAWLIVQHADNDLAFQRHCLDLMVQQPEGEVAKEDIAYLDDRIRVNEGRQQLYGTQWKVDEQDGYIPEDIEDFTNIDERRTAMGMEPFAEYADVMRAMYADMQAKKEERKEADVSKDDFSSLRLEAHEQVDRETLARIRENPIPTEEEILVGAFREMIEPQVRDALFEFNRKGYSTESSGFYGAVGEMQCIDGYFEVDDETKARIEELSGQVLKGKDVGMPGQHEQYTYIRFYPKHARSEEIKAIWDSIAALLPDRGTPAQPSISGASDDFRNTYAKNRLDVEKAVLQKILGLDESDPETTQKMRTRLIELTK